MKNWNEMTQQEKDNAVDADWITGFGYDYPRESLEPDYWENKECLS